MNEIFVDARMRDWDETAEAIAFMRRVRRILAAPDEPVRHEPAAVAETRATQRPAA